MLCGCGTAHACGCELVAQWGLPEQHGSTGAWPSQLPRVPAACKPWGSPTRHMPAPALQLRRYSKGARARGRRAVLAEDAVAKRE